MVMGLMDNAGPERDANSPFGVFFAYFKSSHISLLFFSLLAKILVYLDRNDIDIIMLIFFLLLTSGNSDIKNISHQENSKKKKKRQKKRLLQHLSPFWLKQLL